MIRYGVLTKGLLTAGFALLSLFLFDAGAYPMAAAALAVAAAFGHAAWREQRKPTASPGEALASEKTPSLRTALAVCAILLAIDGLFFGAPMLGVYAGIVLALWLAPRMVFAWRKPALRRHRALVALVTLAMIVFDCSIYWIYETVAQKRVTEVAEALIRYRAIKGLYPEQLQQLVPDYLPAVPAAKPGLIVLNRIWYLHQSPGPTGLMYVSFPPYGRKLFNVQTREWSEID
jgi:NADH:ubiquinone oxidoreductase subunit 6 (subunit J)